jgi:GIY-YIG domain-containing protein
MGWTLWLKIADRNTWYSAAFNYNGAACYELALAGPNGGNLRTVYVGETGNEEQRIAAYAAHGSHLSDIIDFHLRRGWCLWYRAQARSSKSKAAQMQNRLLERFDYDWNLQSN